MRRGGSRFPVAALALVMGALLTAGAKGQAPPADLPGPGIDRFQSSLTMKLNGVDMTLVGPVVVERSAPVQCSDGTWWVCTEMKSMELVDDFQSVIITLSHHKPSFGAVWQYKPGSFFPAGSSFDLFIEVDMPGIGSCESIPVPVEADPGICSFPPCGAAYRTKEEVHAECAGQVMDEAAHTIAMTQCQEHRPEIQQCLNGAAAVKRPPPPECAGKCAQVPALSLWGALCMVAVLFLSGALLIRWRRRQTAIEHG